MSRAARPAEPARGRRPRALDRRRVLAGLAVGLAAPFLPTNRTAAAEAPNAIFARSGLAANTGYTLVDISTGALIEAHRPDVPAPPASVVKLVTAIYALDALGPDFRFHTRLLATGPVRDGVLQGDLILAGAGDPLVDTDALGEMAQALRRAGVRGVSGRFQVSDKALPAIARIDPEQPEEAGYNPAVSGMNLNFNRAYLAWDAASGPRFSAPGQRFDATVASIRAEIGAVSAATLRSEAGAEVWTLPPAALRGRGSRWLPVRSPGRYAGEVFVTLAAGSGIALPPVEVSAALRPGTPLVERPGQVLPEMLRGMLRYSTNLTAEVMGLRATQARGGSPRSLAESAGEMVDWARPRYGLGQASFVNHSGLSPASRMSTHDMARLLTAERHRLPGLMRDRDVLDTNRQAIDLGGRRLIAKTGTLFFTSALAGYLDGARRQLGFAIFSTDAAARARVPPRSPADPPGAKAWAARARTQEQALLRRWLELY